MHACIASSYKNAIQTCIHACTQWQAGECTSLGMVAVILNVVTLGSIRAGSQYTRPAGPPVVRDGKLIRYAQDCSSKYGERVFVFQVSPQLHIAL